MPGTIVQTVTFKTTPDVLFALYTNPAKHTAAIGAKALVSTRIGAKFEAYDGSLTGKTLGVARNRLFVQSWRADDWLPEEPDSILTLFFEKVGKEARLTMVHANIPDEHLHGIKSGWNAYYWTPWKRFLAPRRK